MPRSTDKLTATVSLPIAKGVQHRLDNLVIRHRVREKGRRGSLVDPFAGCRIAQCHSRTIDPIRIRRLGNAQHFRPRWVDPVWPMMITDRFAAPVDLAGFDMREINRRIGRRPFAGQCRRAVPSKGGNRQREQQQQQDRDCSAAALDVTALSSCVAIGSASAARTHPWPRVPRSSPRASQRKRRDALSARRVHPC